MLLSAAMVLSLGITSVSAAATNVATVKIGTKSKSYTSLKEAVAAANAVPEGSTKATITLKSNVPISDTLVFTRDVTLDLGTYKITNN